MRNSVANDASVLGGDEGLVLGVGVLGAGAEELEELVAAPVGLVDQLVGRERLAERVRESMRERREQLAVLGVDGVLRQDGGVLALVGNLGERRGRLAAVVGRARSVARGLVVDEALRRRWARVVEVVLVVELELVDDSPEAKATTDDEAVLINATAKSNLEKNFICVFWFSLFANSECKQVDCRQFHSGCPSR